MSSAKVLAILSLCGSAACATSEVSSRDAHATVSDAANDPCVVVPPSASQTQGNASRDTLRADAEFMRGVALETRGNHADAITAFEHALEADPEHGLAYLAAAEARLATDANLEQAYARLAHAVARLPKNPRAHQRYADVARDLGNAIVAERHWECALELKPELSDVRIELARSRLEGGYADAALAVLAPELERDSNNVRARVMRADILESLGRDRDAAEEIAAAARTMQSSASLYRRAAALFERVSMIERANEMRARADAIDPPPRSRKMRPLPKGRASR